jgi:hypothetical protein
MPDNPTNVRATVAGTSVTVTWTAPANMTGVAQYRVRLWKVGITGYGTDVETNTGSLATTRVMTGVAHGLYFVSVLSVDSGGSFGSGTGDTAPFFESTVQVGTRYQDLWNLKVYAFGLEPLTKPTATSLVVGHATRGQIGSTNVLADLTDPWARATDLTCYVTRIRIEQGKTRALESFGPSRCTMEFEAADDRFDPLSTTGTYCVSSRQQFRRGVPIVVCVEGAGGLIPTSTRGFLWCGWLARSSVEQAEVGNLRTHTIETYDAFDRLGSFDQNALESAVGSGDGLLARVERWLKLAGVVPNDAVAGTGFALTPDGLYGFGGNTTGMSTLQSTNMAQNALTAVKASAASVADGFGNRGAVYVAPTGRVIASGFALVTISSGGIHFAPEPLSEISFAGGTGVVTGKRTTRQVDESAFKNVARFARAGGSIRTAVGAAADELWSIEQRTDLECVDEATVQSLADAFVLTYGREFPAGGPTVRTHFLDPMVEPTAFAYALGAAVMAQADDSWVLGWTHEIAPNMQWETTVTTCEVP